MKTMPTKLERDVRFLKMYAAATTVLLGVAILTGFSPVSTRQKFEEIDVERINIVDQDGKLKMVISNSARQHPGIVNGKIIPRTGPRPPGIIFFNHLGDEMGGLVYGENGGNGHFGSLTWDKVRNDQTIGFRHLEADNGAYESGLAVWQRPDIPGDVVNDKYEAANGIKDSAARRGALRALSDSGIFGATRLFIGKRRDNSSALVMHDQQGKVRIRMQVMSDGSPKLEFLDPTGRVIHALPNTESAQR